jgi:hypothetical protein
VTLPGLPAGRGRTCICATCGVSFQADLTEEEALAESRILWGGIPPEDRGVVCDECFDLFFERAKAAGMIRVGTA